MGHQSVADPRQDVYRGKSWTEKTIGSYPRPKPEAEDDADGEPEPEARCSLIECDEPVKRSRKYCSPVHGKIHRQRRYRNRSPQPLTGADELIIAVLDDDSRDNLRDEASRRPSSTDIVPFRLRLSDGWGELEAVAERHVVESFSR